MADQQAKRVRVDSDFTPVFNKLEDFSQGSEANKKRYERLVTTFEKKYGRKPQFLARAPGRVNIIGEHIDYSGYPVLPMAIEQDIAIACGVTSNSQIMLANVDSDRYPDHTCPAQGFAIDGHSWYHYFLCGHKGVLEKFCIQNPTGMDVLLDGSVPPSAGVSSSSALVCCAALASTYANKVELPSKKDFAELCARSERYIGTEGGGMDQAISFLAEPNKAKMIEFNPIRPTDVQLPTGTTFVISNSLIDSNKAAASSFNERVAECRLAAQVIAKHKGLEWKNTKKLLALQEALGKQLSEMPGIVSECLHTEAYTRDEICQFLGISSEELESESLSQMTRGMQQFELYKRATHVFEEANRVLSFKDTANSGTDHSTTVRLGQLMDDSHTSCSSLYECSCSELDQLVSLCKSSGSLGSRLTGAGWGGCAVSLLEEAKVRMFMAEVAKGYYENDPLRESQLATALFATKPGPGAALCNFGLD